MAAALHLAVTLMSEPALPLIAFSLSERIMLMASLWLQSVMPGSMESPVVMSGMVAAG